ncbi:inclusion body family protein [Trinickia sp. LjRoot230]|uniref:AidA/PixA family protein n=1 Tax=Trinickia sp. LjRoot230 TaxID=3342288 RepID=UPI003ECE3F39
MSIANIAVIVDSQFVINTYGTNTALNPGVPGFHENIYVTVRGERVEQGNASGYLVMKAKEEGETDVDLLRWRMQDISLGSNNQCLITKFNFVAGGTLLTAPEQKRLSLGTGNGHDCFWQSEILEQGRVQYYLNFMIVNNQGRVQGFYTYDPLIDIS